MKSHPSSIRRIAISTGGGDAPGLNAVIKAVVTTANLRGWECVGIRDGYNGLLFPERYPHGGLVPLNAAIVQPLTAQGGTILGSTNKGNPFFYPEKQPDGSYVETDISPKLVAAFEEQGIDALIALGGDGSLDIAHRIAQQAGFLKVIGIPKTIDNDLDKTVVTFGFDTAVDFATDCIDRLHTTARSHGRIMVVEVMGRYAGWIALHAGISGSADAILIPEAPYDLQKVAEHLVKGALEERGYAIVVVAEGAQPKDGGLSIKGKNVGQAERLGGVGEKTAVDLQELTGHEARAVVLGHLLRGGTPTTNDRLISLRFGAAATRALAEGRDRIMIALDPPFILHVPLAEIAGRMKRVSLSSDTVQTARELGICFGDE